MQAVVYKSHFAQKTHLPNLKFDVDKSYIDKLKKLPGNLSNLKSKEENLVVDKLVPIPVDCSKLTDVVKTDVTKYVCKKDVYNTKIKDAEDKIYDITNIASNTTLNAKINKIKKEIPSITNFRCSIIL